MSDQLPDPLVPAEVDLRDFGFMPLDVRTLLTSSLWIRAKKDPRVAHAAVSLWCESWHQVPAGSLPDDDEVLAELARCEEKEWARIKDRALAHFVKCSDGLLYHRLVAQKAVEAWKHKQSQRARTRAATEAREKRRGGATSSTHVQRDDVRDVQRGVDRNDERDDTRDVGRHVHQGTGTGTGTGTINTGASEVLAPLLRAPAGETPGTPETHGEPEPETPPPRPLEAPPSASEPSTKGQVQAPTQAGLACRAMRQAGLQQVNPSDPRLLAVLDLGATPDELADVAREAVGKGKGWPWVLATCEGRRKDAKNLAQTGRATAGQPSEPSGAKANDDADRYRAEEEERRSWTPEQRARNSAAREKAIELARAAISGRPAQPRNPA